MKVKCFAPCVFRSSQKILIEFGMMLGLIGLVNLVYIEGSGPEWYISSMLYSHGVNMGSNSIPPKTSLDESINRGLVCAHMHFIARTQKILTFMS